MLPHNSETMTTQLKIFIKNKIKMQWRTLNLSKSDKRLEADKKMSQKFMNDSLF